jgi:nucleotide-binding universal stress UspA family protein
VAVDGSAGSLEAVRWTARLVSGSSSEVVLVHATGLLEHLRTSHHRSASPSDPDELLDEWARPLALAGVPYDLVVADGPPAQVVLDTARRLRADLVVVGRRGEAQHAGGPLGSTSAQVARHAPCAVAVVPVGPA